MKSLFGSELYLGPNKKKIIKKNNFTPVNYTIDYLQVFILNHLKTKQSHFFFNSKTLQRILSVCTFITFYLKFHLIF